jgi:hypothetical protein
MENQLSNIALEGTCSGDVVGGFIILDRGKPSGVFFVQKTPARITDRGYAL